MKNNSINKFFKRLLTTALTVSLATIPALTPLTVHADMEYQGGEGGKAEGGKHHYTDGVSQNKSGLFVYTLDADGSVTNDTPILVLNQTQSTAWQDGAYQTEPIKTRFDDGGEDKIKTLTLDIPNVIIHQNDKWTSNWHAIREYWDGKESDPTDEGAKGKFIEFMRQRGLWSEAIKMYDNGEPFYIAIETIAWSGKFVNGKSEGKLASTAAGWAKFYQDKGMTYSDSSMKSFYSAALPFSLTLDRTMFGWSVPNTLSGYVTNDDIRDKGYGMNFILVNGSTGHSIVTPTPAPADVESETPTNYSVIKVYERENPETKEIVSEGSYITTNAYSDLTVNEEEGWKIISVETVSPQIKTIGSNDVYEVVKGDT